MKQLRAKLTAALLLFALVASLSPAALAALRRIVCADPKKLFSFRLDGASLHQLEALSERYLLLQLDRGFGTLDFYKQLSI